MVNALIGMCVVAIAGQAGLAQQSLQVGEPLPTLEGQFLTGSPAVLPNAATGRVTLIAMGFTYASRVSVEAWADWYRTAIGSRTDVTFFEVPMLGGFAKLGRWFIERGMRSGTPAELHDHVITVYRNTGDWKRWLSYSRDHADDAYLIVLDRKGVVRWLHHGVFDVPRSEELKGLLTSLADGRPFAAGSDPSDRPLEP